MFGVYNLYVVVITIEPHCKASVGCAAGCTALYLHNTKLQHIQTIFDLGLIALHI